MPWVVRRIIDLDIAERIVALAMFFLGRQKSASRADEAVRWEATFIFNLFQRQRACVE